MSDDFLSAELSKTVAPKEMEFEFWVVVARWSHGGFWKIFPELYTSQIDADEFANNLPEGYTFKYVFRVSNKTGGEI